MVITIAHRFNNKLQKKTPKPAATERTWSRWRMRKNIQTRQDENRISKIEEVKQKALERLNWFRNLHVVKKNE